MPGIDILPGKHGFLEAGDDIIFFVKAIDDRIPPDLRPRLARDLVNLPIFWRHQTPQKKGFEHQPVYGKVIAAKEYPGGVMAACRIYGSSEKPDINARRKALVNLIKKTGELGVEMNTGVSLTYDSVESPGRGVIEAHPIELSVTPWPACNTCVIRMTEQPKTAEVESAIESALKKATVEELVELLNKTKIELEDERKKTKELEENSGKKIKELESSIKAQDEKISKLVSELESERKARVEAERAPHVAKLKELDKKGLFDDEIVKSMSIEKIKEKISKLLAEQEVASKIAVTTMAQTAIENQKLPSPREEILKKMQACEKGTAIYKHYESELERYDK